MNSILIRDKLININEPIDGFWKSVQNGTWEPYTFDIFDKFLDSTQNYIDLGAWIGPTVIYGSQLSKVCYAIEPDPIAHAQLLNNIFINERNNIRTFDCAIFNYDGTLTLGNDSNLGNSVTRVRQSNNLVDVKCYTLSTFMSKYNIQDVNFIKVDVEGSEEFIFDDIEFFREFRPTVYVSLHTNWFVDSKKGRETIIKIGNLYKHCYDVYLNKIDISDKHGAYIFTD